MANENHVPSTEEADWKEKVFESLSLPALILTPDRRIVSVNRNFQKKFGKLKEDIVGRSCHNFFYHSEAPCEIDFCPLSKVLADRVGHTSLRRVMGASGKEAWEDRVFSPILDDEGNVRYIIESIRDVTKLKTLEKELVGIRAFMEKLVQSSTSGIIAANRRGRILVINQAAEELTGYSMEQAQKGEISAMGLYRPGEAKKLMMLLRDETYGGRGKLPCTRTTLVSAQGEEIPVELTAAIIYDGNREVGTMGIFNDLREKLAHEERMNRMLARISQAEKLASLGQLAAGVAHEINNPLTGILLFANLILENLPPEDPRQAEVKYIIDDANRCGEIVKNLLAYSRQTSQNKEILHLNTLLENGLSLIRDQKLFMNIDIVKDLSDEMMLIHADKNQLGQVIINLVMNAVDAMSRKGTLTFRTYRDKAAKKVYLEASDTGCGIPKENLSRIFDPFFTTKAVGKGTGLGLSTVYGIVHENGGNIWVKDTSPEGTTFIVELPLYQVAYEEHAPTLPPLSQLPGKEPASL
ncbi:MAG: PAS domain S-box protein [Desulfobacterota bacterium]|jgi:PAS domain S-box-containing protein|nr:PAS domain S-box protein [Thermodesulfobacteriota bacterium]